MISTMRVFENQTFKDFDDRDSAAVFSDLEFLRCHFDYCSISITHDPKRRSTVRNVRLLNCTAANPYIDRAIIEDALTENAKWPGLFQTFGTVFKHVILRGKFGRLMISNDVLPRSDVNPPFEYENVEAFREANAAYYRNVDWALDISQGEFKELDIRGVPGRLIRRDPETQILVTRQRVLQDDWRDLPFQDSLTPFSLDFMLKQELPDTVLIAPKRHRKFPLYLADLQMLRDAGVAEPD
jgi:hypothetical protein